MGDKRAVFLDRDGVVNPLVPNRKTGQPDSPHHPDDVVLYPGVAGAIGRLRAAGFLVVLISNQPSVARGKCTFRDLEVVHSRLVELLAREGAILDGAYYCHHDPAGVVPELAIACECRKPKPGLVWRAKGELGIDLSKSWMVGDRAKDLECGRAAGCLGVLVTPSPETGVIAEHIAPDLESAAVWILASAR